MKRTWIFAIVFATAMWLLCGLNAFAQQKETAPATVPEIRVNTLSGQMEKVPLLPGANTFNFVNSEFVFDGKPIKGSPYSAEAVTETTQVLGDGNRIVNRSTATLFRDSEGRTRREASLNLLGAAPRTSAPKLITIMDSVAGFRYMLDSERKIAHRMAIRSTQYGRDESRGAGRRSRKG